MTQKTMKDFIGEISSQLPKKKYFRNKTNVHDFDDFWSLNTIDLKD